MREEYAHEHCLSPPFDEDDELDLRALYRKPRAGGSPELEAAVRRAWHPGHGWHPGWAAAACAVLVAGLFAWTDMRENAEMADLAPQLAVSQEAPINIERSPAPRPILSESPAPQSAPAPAQRAASTPADAPSAIPAPIPPCRRPPTRRRKAPPPRRRPGKPVPNPSPSANRTLRPVSRTSVP